MAPRAKLSKVQVDTDFFEKPKVEALEYRWGDVGVNLYLRVLCLMGPATDGEIDRDCIRSIARRKGWDEAKADEFVQYLLDRDMIHQGSKPFLVSNRRIQADQEAVAAKQEKWRTEKRASRGQSADISQTPSGPVKTEDLKNEHLNTEILNIELTKKFDTPEVRQALGLWAATLKKHRKSLDQIAINAMQSNYGGRPVEDLIRNLTTAAQNGWKNLNEVSPEQSKNGKDPPQRKTYAELEEERRKRILFGEKTA